MKSRRSFVLLAWAGLAGSAFAQCPSAPPVDLDLGVITPGTPINNTVTVPSNAQASAWVKFTLAAPVRMADLTFLNLTTGGTTLDTELGLYNCNGDLMATDDDDEAGLQSALSFGSGDAQFAGAGGVISNGRDGLLAAGDYYLAVNGYPATFALTGFGADGDDADIGQTIPVNALLGTATAAGQPAGTIDLGTMSANDTRARTGETLNAGEIRWFKVTVPASQRADATFFDIDTEGSSLSPTNATRIALYTATGAIAGSLSPTTRINVSTALTDTTDGTNSLSQMSFGTGTRPAPGNGLPYNGRDGDIQAGTYFIAIAGPGSAPSSTGASGQNFGLVSTSTNAGTFNLQLATGVQTVSPTGTGTASGCVLNTTGGASTVTVTVTPGSNPPSTGITVTLDATQVNLGSAIALSNGGSGNVYTTILNIPPGVVPATYQLPFTVADQQGRSTTANVSVVVSGLNPAESIANANVPSGSGTLTTITGSISANQADLYRIRICDPANFGASTVGGATFDTQLFLFRADGTGVTSNDDHVGGTTLQSVLTSQFVSDEPVGDYILAITRYNRDPISDPCVTTSTLWTLGTRAEGEPTNPAPVAAWTGAFTLPANPSYTISLTGACYSSGGPVCDTIDFNNDGVFPSTDDITDFLSVFSGGPCSTDPTPGCNDLDFNNDGVFPAVEDIGSLLSVFSGGPCL